MKVDLDNIRYENVLKIIIAALIVVETLIFLSSLFPPKIAFVSNLFVAVNFFRNYLYRVAVLVAGMLALIWFMKHHWKHS